MRRSRHTNQPNSKSATGPSSMVRKSKEDIDHEFFDELANNTPNDSQFQTKKRVNNKKKKSKKPEIKSTETGFMGLL